MPLPDGFSSPQQFQSPMHSPGVQYPGGALFGAGDSPAPNQVNFSARQSVHLDGSDLPLHDIATLRFFYNLGLQTYNVVMKAIQYPSLAMYSYEEEPVIHNRPLNTGIPIPDPNIMDVSGLRMEGSYPPAWTHWPPEFQSERSLCRQHHPGPSPSNYMQWLPAYPYQPPSQNSDDVTYYVPVRLITPGHRHC